MLLNPDFTGSKALGVKRVLNHKDPGNRQIGPELIESANL